MSLKHPRTRGQAPRELAREPRLSDARLTHDSHQLWIALPRDALEGVQQELQVALATYKRSVRGDLSSERAKQRARSVVHLDPAWARHRARGGRPP